MSDTVGGVSGVGGYGSFMERHGGLVSWFVTRAAKGCPRHAREDLEQAAALAVVEALAALPAGADDGATLRHVASRVATALNVEARPSRRRSEREVPAGLQVGEDVLDETDIEDLAHQAWCEAALAELVGLLPHPMRAVAEARFVMDPPATYAAIGDQLGISLGAARYLETKARRELAALARERGVIAALGR